MPIFIKKVPNLLIPKGEQNIFNRYLEKRIEEKYTCTEIIETIRNMNLNKISEIGYIPAYTRTEITDILHDKFNFRTDNEITKNNKMKKILKNIK